MKPLHFGDLLALMVEAGLDLDGDASAWLEAHGVCPPAADQYAAGIVEGALGSGDELGTLMRGIFHSGLTLGIAVGERNREAAAA